MTLATVRHQIELPGGQAPRGRVRGLLRLWATDDGDDAFGYAAGADRAVGGAREVSANRAGLIEFTGVAPNSGSSDDVITDPANTVYELTVIYPDGRRIREFIAVPDSAGPHWVHEIRTTAPSTLTATQHNNVLGRGEADAHPASAIARGASTVDADLTALEAGKLDADGGVLVSDLDAAGNKVTGLADGTASTDAVSVVQAGAKVSPISPHHGLVMSGWTAAIAEYASDRPLRVMVISDSMGELWIFGQAFETIHLSLVGAGRNRLVWWGPSWAFAGLTHTTVEGTASDIGIDQRGRVLTSGDQIVTAGRAGTVCAVRYTSRPGGGTFTVKIDGGSPVPIDTSEDENGDPVAATTPGQVMRVTELDYEEHTITIECTSGEVWIEATAVGVPEGLQVVGIGRSGESTQGHIDAGQAVATLKADVARGEAPDLIILASDTSDLVTAATVTGPLTTLLGQLRAHAPDASYLLWIPPDHQGASDWPAVVAAMRGWAIENDVAFVDTYHGLGGADGGGDWSNDSDPKGYSGDGVHPAGTKAIYAVSDLLLGALWSASRLQAVAKVWSEIAALDSAKVDAALFDANTILKADADNTPEALTVGEDTLVGRVSGGNIDALTVAEARSLLVVGNQVSGKVLITGSSAKTAAFSTPFSFADLADGDQFEAELIVAVVNASGWAETVKVWATLEHDTDSDQELVTTGASDLSVPVANNVLRKLIHVRVRGVYTVEGAVWSTQTTATIDNGDTLATNVDSLRLGSLNSGYTLQFYVQLSASSPTFLANGRAWARRIPVLS